MTALRPLDIAPFQALAGEIGTGLGPAPTLDWIEVSKLVIDPTYQREIFRRGARNVVRIARQFDWRKFAPVIVAPIEGGRFAIVDGQHRSTAAALRGIKSVPCQIIMADPKAQAEAFAAINGNVTAMTPLQIHVAKVASGDPDAMEIDALCRNAGVTICRYPVPANNMKRGETLAIGAIRSARRNYGDDILSLAMRCILAAPNGNPGLVRADIINALCSVINEEKAFAKREPLLLSLMAGFDFAAKLAEAEIDARRRKMTISAALAAIIFDYLDSEIGEAA